jgi:TM2 domain-containing membrane protein YozV
MQSWIAPLLSKIAGVANNPTTASPAAPPPPREFTPLPAFLSFLIPGLGQIYQGRVAKGLLFLVSIYALFFYGMYLGSGTVKAGESFKEYYVSGNVYIPQTQEKNKPPVSLPPLLGDLYNRPQYLGQFWVGVVAWPALWQYFVYDEKQENGPALLGQYERTPSEEALNAVNTFGDKLMELGWVYTVIAGVLNILVIYDAFAGPAFLLPLKPDSRKATA